MTALDLAKEFMLEEEVAQVEEMQAAWTPEHTEASKIVATALGAQLLEWLVLCLLLGAGIYLLSVSWLGLPLLFGGVAIVRAQYLRKLKLDEAATSYTEEH